MMPEKKSRCGDDLETGAEAHRFAVQVTADSHFSWLRTRFSVERTAMSWVRTAVALIGFGFTIVQFFERLGTMKGTAPALIPHAPVYVGLALIGAGILAQVIALWQYRTILNYLGSGEFRAIGTRKANPILTPITVISIVMILIGLLAFLAVITRAI